MSPREALIRMRAELGMTQVELAEKLNIGFVTINRWENGKSFPSRAHASNIIRTAQDLGVSEDCIQYLNAVLLPPRMRGRPATELGFPALAQELLCQMVDGSPAGVVVIDEATKQVIYVNRKAEELTGKNYFAETDKHCWSYLRDCTKSCADCDPARYPLTGHCEWIVTTPRGLKLKYRTRSIIWLGKKVYTVYITNETELMESKEEVGRLTSLFPAGAGVFYVYHDGRFAMKDAYYHQLGEHGAAQKYAGLDSMGEITPGDMKLLREETKAAIAENRDINIQIRGRIKGHRIQLFARQFAQDEEKRMFFCSFVDVDRYMEDMAAARGALR